MDSPSGKAVAAAMSMFMRVNVRMAMAGRASRFSHFGRRFCIKLSRKISIKMAVRLIAQMIQSGLFAKIVMFIVLAE